MTQGAKPSIELLEKGPRHLRRLVVLFLPLPIVSAPAFEAPWYIHEWFEISGIICLLVCLVGRGWTSVYIAGRKNRELVMAGPYSIVRNPLYVFSFIGLIGIALISEMATLLLISAAAFALYYRMVVKREEGFLAKIHGESFLEYVRTVPRWFPRLSGWRDISTLEVRPQLIGIQLIDSSMFFIAYIFFKVCEHMRDVGFLVPIIHIP